MKKIFLLFAAACAFFACDPVHEDIGNDGHITADQLKSMTSITVDKAAVVPMVTRLLVRPLLLSMQSGILVARNSLVIMLGRR